MLFGKSYWKTSEQGIQREWLLTNGIGGFSCSTIIGMNSRRYHGLLIASLNPPVERHLVLSGICEAVSVDNEDFYLHSFKTPDFTAHGEYYLEALHYNEIAEFHYRIGEMRIVKKVCLRYGKNQVAIVYSVKNPVKCTLRLTPLINFRNYHYLSQNRYMSFTTDINEKSMSITPFNMDCKINLDCSEGKIVENQSFFYNMDYAYEHERGLNGTEDHYIPGFYEIELKEGEEKTITLICSFNEPIDLLDGDAIINEETQRQKSILTDIKDDFLKQLVLAADKFIVHRNSTKSKTIIAGYPWFTDWGRDTMIAFTGLTLSTKRYEEARSILYTFSKYEKYGLIPNVFPDGDDQPAYNTVDAALWFFEAVYKYIQYTKDLQFVKDNITNVLKRIISGYKNGTIFNINMDRDYLISAGDEYTQLTWMDAKAGNWVVTPRHGKAVEINALWYNALMIMSFILNETGENGREYQKIAEKTKKSFLKLFWNHSEGCLYDVINDNGKDGKIRPNQILSVSLSFPVLEGQYAKSVVDTVYKRLYTANGLRTLNQNDPDYRGIYIGDQYKRDGSYHQGTVWVWPLGQFITAYRRVYSEDKNLSESLKYFYLPFNDHIHDACIGNISEIFDGNEPLISRGCFAQAWSVSEILRSYVEDYLPLLIK